MPSKYKIELGKTDRKRSKIEVVLNASIGQSKPQLPIVYERDDADFDSDTADGLWGFVGGVKTSTMDMLTDEGVALIQFLRSMHVVTKIHIPPMALRIFVYVSPDKLENLDFRQDLLSSLQHVAENPDQIYAGTNGAGLASRMAQRAGRAASAITS